MARMVMCRKLGRELPGMTFKPFPNELGQRVFDQISQEAWKMWLEHFKMIMNEYRLSPADPRTTQILYGQCEQFFFGPGRRRPARVQAAVAPPSTALQTRRAAR